MMPEDETTEKSDLSFSELVARIVGYVVAVALWIALALFFGMLGGKAAGLREGGWNFQFMPLVVGAFFGGPILGTIVTVIRSTQGRDYGTSLMQATSAVAVLSFPIAAIFYFFYENK